MMTALGVLLAAALAQDDFTVLSPEDRPRKMLNAYVVAQSEKLLADRRAALASLKTPDDVRKRQDRLRAKFLESLGGFPERTPLNARITGTLRRSGYRIEKVIYEVRPDLHVTANLYLPDGPGPFPGILFPLGHYDNPKPAEEYQRTCILFARNGLAVLTYDPIGQGERYQVLGPDRKPRARGTSEHTLVDVGALLVGTCSAQYFIWEGVRGLDYLASRSEIDPKKLGCVGNSGGGTMTAYMMAIDERVACAVPNCFITSVEKLYATIGPQDGEANLPGLVAAGMGHSDYSILRAPRPTQLSTPTRDYYDIEGAWATFREAKRVYAVLGHSERMDLFEYDDKHSISRPFREAAVRWLRRWLVGVDEATVEVEGPIEKPEDLQCTTSGHVVLDFQEKTPYHYNAELATKLASSRVRKDPEELQNIVRRRINLQNPFPPASVTTTGNRMIFRPEPGIQIPGLVCAPKETRDVARILYVNGGGKSKDRASIERWTSAGHWVLAIDLRGMGETEPEAPHRGLANFFTPDWKEAYISFNMNRPLLGQRVQDVLSIVAAIDTDGRGVHVVAVGAAAPVALHATLLDPRIRALTVEDMVISWTAVAQTAITHDQLSNVVPCALQSYDLPDVAAALAPRPLTILSSRDPAGAPVSQAAVGDAYAAARSAYEEKGATSALLLRAEPVR